MQPASFARRFGPWAIVAGASEGLGAAFADALASQGINLVMIARRESMLQAYASRVRALHGVSVLPLVLDLASESVDEALSAAIDQLDVGLLVYNACAAKIEHFISTPAADLDAIVACNCRGLVRLARLIAPRLVDRGGGGILVMSSMSGFHGHATAAAYCASKAFCTAFGEALWAELDPLVTVRVCAAGATTTPNFLNATPGRTRAQAMPMKPERVVDIALCSLQRKSAGPVVVPGLINRAVEWLMRRLLTPRMAVQFMSANVRRVYELPSAKQTSAEQTSVQQTLS